MDAFIRHVKWQLPSIPWDTFADGEVTFDHPNRPGVQAHVALVIEADEHVTIALMHDKAEGTAKTHATRSWSAAVDILKQAFMPHAARLRTYTLD